MKAKLVIALPQTKVCIDCGVEKAIRFFDVSKGRYISPYCKHCTQHKYSQKKYQLAHHYGLSLHDYENMEVSQRGQCAICHKDGHGHLVVDHDHATGNVRGLLCGKCNLAIGLLEDNEEFLFGAIGYLRAHREDS